MARKKVNVDEALLKVALGYQIAEITEEYTEANGELKLVKCKKTKKDVPPDLKAVQMLLGGGENGISALSDEELEAEKQRLLAQLQEKEGGRVETNAKAVPKKTVKKAKTPTEKTAAEK